MDAESGEPSGEKAVTWIWRAAHQAISASLRWYGWTGVEGGREGRRGV
jgi:hypothetical protein